MADYSFTKTHTDEPEQNQNTFVDHDTMIEIFPFLQGVCFDKLTMIVGLITYEVERMDD